MKAEIPVKGLWQMLTEPRIAPASADGSKRLKILQRRRIVAILAFLFGILSAVLFRRAIAERPAIARVFSLLLFPGIPIYISVLSHQIYQEKRPHQAVPSAPVPLSLSRTIGWAAALYVFDGLLMGQGLVSALVLGYALIWVLPSSFAAGKDRALCRFRMKKAAILATAVLACFATMYFNNQLAAGRANHLVSAVKQYKVKYGQYPQRLDEVAPEFIASVPAAKFALAYNQFIYTSTSSNDRHLLWYVVYPPFGRRVYVFESDTWGTLD